VAATKRDNVLRGSMGPLNTNYPELNDLSALELDQIRQLIEESDDLLVSEEMAALIADEWPWLLEKVQRPKPH
jgi:methionine synthase I (cobalamin-dependent)